MKQYGPICAPAPILALSAITAAVVGVILNLAIWFALHTLFAQVVAIRGYGFTVSLPVPGSVNWPALALSAAAMIAIFRFKVGLIPTLVGCSALGALYYLLVGVP